MKKSLALLLTLAMVFSMVLPVGAFSFETVETVVGEPLTEESAEPAAALAADVVIGKNLFTGTADLLTFDDESQADLFNLLDNLSKSVVSDPVSLTDGTTKIDPDGKYGNMLQLHRDANAPRQWTGYTLAQKFDGSRAYWLTWDERIDMKDLRVVWGVIMSLNGANKHQDIGMANAMNKWRHYSATTTPNSNEFRYWCKITNVQPAECTPY